jgi:sugar lactone lactonase YvrE
VIFITGWRNAAPYDLPLQGRRRNATRRKKDPMSYIRILGARALLALATFALLLAACGGGSGPGEPVYHEVSLLAGSIGGMGLIDGTGTDARFQGRAAIAADPQGNLVAIDSGIPRSISPSGVVMTLSKTRTYPAPDSVALEAGGTYWTAGTNGVHRVSAAGDQFLAGFARAIAADGQGNAYVAMNCAVWKITPALEKSLLAGVQDDCRAQDGPFGEGHFLNLMDMATDRHGALYVLDAQGDPYASPPYYWATVRKIAQDGTITTLAGGDGTSPVDGNGLQARFKYPNAIAADGLGNIYVADWGAIRRIDPALNVTTLALDASSPTAINDMAADEQGNLYLQPFLEPVIRVLRPGSNGAILLAGMPADTSRRDGQGAGAAFDSIDWTALDNTGDVLAAGFSWENGFAIRRVTPAGIVTTEATQTFSTSAAISPRGYTYDPKRGVHYVAVTNFPCSDVSCFVHGSAIWQMTKGGVLAPFVGSVDEAGTTDGMGTQARFSGLLTGPAIDAQGNLYVADGARLRKITPDGVVTTITEQIFPAGNSILAVDALGVDATATVYALCADWVLRKITPDGHVTDVAGAVGQGGYVDDRGTAARFQVPSSAQITVDSAGNLYIGENVFSEYSGGEGTIRKVTPDGTVTTIAGQTGKYGIVLGPLPAQFYAPTGVLWTPGALVFGARNALLKVTQ